ncbi:MAG: hypothetical protein LUQ16_02290 [Methanomassiliicoccales archaeon]|jgi:hypothetical protein|nr:hypothetical protein [Methanomassiliicoccales archaeon]
MARPSLDKVVGSCAVAALVIVSVALALALAPSPQGAVDQAEQEQDTGNSDYEPWSEPTLLPPPSYFEDDDEHSFMGDYHKMAVGGTRIHFQNLTVSNGTVNTTFDVDARWFCINIYMYKIPLDSSTEWMYEEYWLTSPEVAGSSGGTGYSYGEGGSGETTFLYNDGPYGTWSFEYSITNGSAIIWIEGYHGVPSDFGA